MFITMKIQQHGLGFFEEQLSQRVNSGGRKKRHDQASAVDIAFNLGSTYDK